VLSLHGGARGRGAQQRNQFVGAVGKVVITRVLDGSTIATDLAVTPTSSKHEYLMSRAGRKSVTGDS